MGVGSDGGDPRALFCRRGDQADRKRRKCKGPAGCVGNAKANSEGQRGTAKINPKINKPSQPPLQLPDRAALAEPGAGAEGLRGAVISGQGCWGSVDGALPMWEAVGCVPTPEQQEASSWWGEEATGRSLAGADFASNTPALHLPVVSCPSPQQGRAPPGAPDPLVPALEAGR